jgi:hypothetical protein
MVLTQGAQLCRVVEVREEAQECLVCTADGRHLNRDFRDLHPTELLVALEEAFRLPAPRKPYNGGQLVAAIPMHLESLSHGYACVVLLNDLRGHYVGFFAQELGQPTWGQGHYFMEDLRAALKWAAKYAGLSRAY